MKISPEKEKLQAASTLEPSRWRSLLRLLDPRRNIISKATLGAFVFTLVTAIGAFTAFQLLAGIFVDRTTMLFEQLATNLNDVVSLNVIDRIEAFELTAKAPFVVDALLNATDETLSLTSCVSS